MASELGVQTIQHTNGTDALTIDSSGIVTMANTAIFSIFRNTANLTANGNITAWEVPDAGIVASNVGGTFTHSGGLWTFPRTGVYIVRCNGRMINKSGDSILAIALWGTSDNGSNFTRLAYVGGGSNSTNDEYSSNHIEALVNISDTSTHKVEVRGESIASSSLIYGNSDYNTTTISFQWIAPAQ